MLFENETGCETVLCNSNDISQKENLFESQHNTAVLNALHELQKQTEMLRKEVNNMKPSYAYIASKDKPTSHTTVNIPAASTGNCSLGLAETVKKKSTQGSKQNSHANFTEK